MQTSDSQHNHQTPGIQTSAVNTYASYLKSVYTQENFNPGYEAFRKHSADLLTVIQDPEVLAWELYAENVISPAVRNVVNNTMHERGERTSKLLAAVDSRIAVDPRVFDVFLSILAKRPPMSDLCSRMKDAYSKSNSGWVS